MFNTYAGQNTSETGPIQTWNACSIVDSWLKALGGEKSSGERQLAPAQVCADLKYRRSLATHVHDHLRFANRCRIRHSDTCLSQTAGHSNRTASSGGEDTATESNSERSFVLRESASSLLALVPRLRTLIRVCHFSNLLALSTLTSLDRTTLMIDQASEL